MLCDISRGDALLLMGRMCMPEFMKDKFAVVGIMQAIMPLGGNVNASGNVGENALVHQEIIYKFDDSAFSNVSDVVLGSMYSELKKFCIWYWQKKEHIQQRQCKPMPIYNFLKLGFIHTCQPHMCAYDIEAVAVHFADVFISQWRKYVDYEEK